MRFVAFILAIILVLATATSSLAVPTRITVHVLTKGAKFLGTSMGGALVTLRDAQTGRLLAEGLTSGGTGDTKRTMETPLSGKASLSDENTAAFSATIDIDSPVLVEASAYGPMVNRQAANRVSATQWVVPGKDIAKGDAWLLLMPGFAVEVVAPPTHIKLDGPLLTVRLDANVTMMWGCPVTPGGLWDAEKIEVAALLKGNGEAMGTLPLRYAGTASQFTADWKVETAGVYEATVYAYDPENGNTGLDSVTFIVE